MRDTLAGVVCRDQSALCDRRWRQRERERKRERERDVCRSTTCGWQVKERWVGSIGEMSLTRENQSTWRIICRSFILSTTNPTRIGLGLNPCFRSVTPATNCLGHSLKEVWVAKYMYWLCNGCLGEEDDRWTWRRNSSSINKMVASQ